jgi:hypothetical protein
MFAKQVSTYTDETDLQLADGSVIYRDGLGRHFRVDANGDEHSLTADVEAPAPIEWGCNCAQCTAMLRGE